MISSQYAWNPETEERPDVPGHTLIRLLASGSYGDVWLARNILGTHRAVKIVYRHRFEDVQPFQREFDGIRRFEPISRTHHGFVHILQIGQTPDGNCFYYVMELADDANSSAAEPVTPDAAAYLPRTLRSDIKREGRLSVRQCLRLGVDLAEALECLHEHRLVHRDIKPSNIIFVNSTPKLADIGLVAHTSEAQSMVGTHGYIPPEGPGTPQADLYSLGKVLYESATGKDRMRFPEPLSDLSANAEMAELNHVILKACHSDPRCRYASARALREDLVMVQSGKSAHRLHQLERRMARAVKLGALALALVTFAFGGWILQRKHSRQVTGLADESRQRLVRLHVVSGLQRLEEMDFFSALPWFAEALRLSKTEDEAWPHVQRIQAVIGSCPRLTGVGRHGDAINSAEFSGDGRYILTTSDDGTARIWNAFTGEPRTGAMPHEAAVNEGHFDKAGSKVVTTAADGAVRIWMVDTGDLLLDLRAAGTFSEASFNPDSNLLLTVGMDHSLSLRHVPSGKSVGQPMLHAARINHAEFSPDGRFVVTAGHEGRARLWRIPECIPIALDLSHDAAIRWAAFSPDGKCIATISDDGTARVWDFGTGQPLTKPLPHASRGYYVTFSPNGQYILTCAGDERNSFGEARVWHAKSGKPITPPLRHNARIKHGCFSPSGLLAATASHDKTVRLWDTIKGEPLGPPIRHGNLVWSVAFSPDGSTLLSAGREGLWRLWDMRVKHWVARAAPFRVARASQNLHFDGRRVVAASPDYTVRTWMISAPEDPYPPLVHTTNVFASKVSRNGKQALTADAGGVVRLWTLASGEMLTTPLRHIGPAYTAAFSADDGHVASGGRDCTAQLWDITKRISRSFRHERPVWFVEFSPTLEHLATCSGDIGQDYLPTGLATLRVWDLTTGSPIGLVFGHESSITYPAFSPDGRRIIVGCRESTPGANHAHIWDTRTGSAACSPLRHEGGIVAVAFSSDGRRVATASADGSARIWDATTGEPVTPLFGHRSSLVTISFSPEGRRLLTCGVDGTVRIWDAHTGDSMGPSLKHPTRVNFARFSPAGDKIVTAQSGQGVIRIWDCAIARQPTHELLASVNSLCGAYIDPVAGLTLLTPTQIESAWLNSQGGKRVVR